MKQAFFASILALMLIPSLNAMGQEDKKVLLKDQGSAALKKKDIDGAINLYNQALLLDPSYMPAIYNMGIAYAKKEDWDKSIYYFSKYLDFDKKDKVAWYNLGFAHAHKNMFQEALDNYKQALEIDPNFYQAKFNYYYIKSKIK